MESSNLLIYIVRKTDHWWRAVGESAGFDRTAIVSDLKGDSADYAIADAFNLNLKRDIAENKYFDEQELVDIIARCRVLRWLPKPRAVSMINAMASCFEDILNKESPAVIVSFPIDRYVSDVLERLGKKRNIPYVELTASLWSKMSMLMYRGKLIPCQEKLESSQVKEKIAELTDPLFKPSYVQVSNRFTAFRFLKTFTYFKVRGWAFKLISLIKNDTSNLHYVDAQSFLGHKPRLKDISILNLIDKNWKEKLEVFPKEKRVLFGLQLFPEASIDYWIDDLGLVDYENMLVEAAELLSAQGYLIAVKDHPLQFGFRQVDLIKRLKAIPNTVIIPYEVSANEMISNVGISFTTTGTIGFQAALIGVKSIVVDNYYSNSEDFIVLRNREDVKRLPQKLSEFTIDENVDGRQTRLVSHVLKGSFSSDFFSFESFGEGSINPSVEELGERFGEILRDFIIKKRQ